MTVSASIPAAVTSMAILWLFRQSNILKHNIVQTAASSGEALAAGVIFTIPALLLIGYWTSFDYRQTAAIALVGGLLGVLFTIPLRRLIVGARLRFPEGVATAEVLKVGSPTGLVAETDGPSQAAGAAGFIIGLKTALVVFLGGALGRYVDAGEFTRLCRKPRLPVLRSSLLGRVDEAVEECAAGVLRSLQPAAWLRQAGGEGEHASAGFVEETRGATAARPS